MRARANRPRLESTERVEAAAVPRERPDVVRHVFPFLAAAGLIAGLAGWAQAEPAPNAPPTPPSAFAAGRPLPVAALRDAGDETALAAAESFVRAAVAGDAATVAEMSMFTWHENAHRLFRDVPAPLAAQAGSPEKLVALAEVNAFARVQCVQVIARVIVSATEEIVGLRAHRADGAFAEHLLWLRAPAGPWLRVEPATTVARLARLAVNDRPPDATDPATFREQYAWIVPQTGPKPPLGEP